MSDVAIQTLKELVSIPSVLGQTRAAEEYVASRAREVEGSVVEFVEVEGIGRNVVARTFADGNLPTIVLNGHLDTVGVCEGWETDPFEAVVKGDRLYGLGSADMKAGIAIALEAFRLLTESGKANVTLAATVDEEGDSAGAFELVRRGLSGDLAILTEPTSGNVMLGCRGRVVFDISVTGRSAHGARPEQGVNAITEMARFVSALGSIKPREHKLLGRGSLCPLAVSGGTRTLSVPERCTLELDRHYVLGETVEGMRSELLSIVKELGSGATFDIELHKGRSTPFLEPYLTPRTGLASDFIDAVGADITYGKSVGDYNVFAKLMPTLVYGPAGENWHSANEWVSLSSVSRCFGDY